jgi:hypothetical protein
MDRPDSSDVTSRRTFIRLGAIACPVSCLLARTEFWNTKDLTNYSDDEMHRMVNNSPWAKTTRAEAPGVESIQPVAGCGAPAASTSGAPLPTRTPSPCGARQDTGAVHASPRPDDAKEALAFYGQVTVRWESAEPILQVTRTLLPDQFRNHHVISVTGLPAGILSNGSTPLPAAVLSARKRPPEQAEFVALISDKLTLLFGFPKRNPVIKASDKALSFSMDLSGIRIKARFDPKEMIYRGQLAL